PGRSSSPCWARRATPTPRRDGRRRCPTGRRGRRLIGAHARALAFFGGVPRQIVPDNLKAGVLQANWHEPGLNPTYQDFARHYGTAILPPRPWRPRDKAKVEVGVQIVERWILARLRDQRFFALSELNR